MSSLLDFPLPIVEDIVKFLCPHCYPAPRRRRDPPSYWGQYCNDACPNRPNDRESQAALASLCRTNKLLNYIATPLLYHTPFYGYRQTQQKVAKTILDARPELAQHVKSVHLVQSDFDESLLSGEASQLIEKVAGKLEAVYDVDRDSTPYFLALMAGRCTNMEELCILAHSDERSPVPFSAPGSLPKLNRLMVSHWDTEGGFDLSRLKDLFEAAPNITSLFVHNMDRIQPGRMNMRNMKELYLSNTVLGPDELRILLEHCPKLERLRYDIGDACVTDEGWPTAREVQDVISHTCPGLKSLTLEVSDGVLELLDVTEEDTLRSLKLLERLETLELQEELLYPVTMVQTPSNAGFLEPDVLVDLLPASIRTVRIGMVGSGGIRPLVPAILRLGRVCKEEFPQLESIWFHNLAVDVDAEKTARELFEGKGIKFRSELQPYWEE